MLGGIIPTQIAPNYAGLARLRPMRRGRRPNDRPPTKYPNRLGEIRAARGISQDRLAAMTDNSISQQTIGKLERGDLRLKDYQIHMLAKALMVDPGEIVSQPRRTVNVVGYIGAGAQVYPFDDHAQGAGLSEISCPPNLNPEDTVAVVVVGDSMPPMEEGWSLFYSRRHESPPSELIGKLCAVKVANDGPLLVKQVRRGPTPGKFNLVSANAPLIEDAELEWAAPIRNALPPDR
jgi:transcriptional regulator with XRE-family HTH domain